VEPCPKRTIGAKKTMLICFWGIRGPLLVETLPEHETLDGDYICKIILPHLEEAARVNRPSMGLKGLKLCWDNARPHISRATTEALHQAGVAIIPQPPYSPDLAPSDFSSSATSRRS